MTNLKSTDSEPFHFGEATIAPGKRAVVDLPVSDLSNRLPMALSIKVIHGKRPGPVLFVSAAVHGDEVIGVEIIRRLIKRPALKTMCGTLLLAPIVNGYGFLAHSRYLPDRRDLNRSFPGSATGSLAGRLAHVFLNEVVTRADFGVDIHSAAIHRSNLPQIRIADGDEKTLGLAKAFGAPAIVMSSLREGSLRREATKLGVPVLVFEGGEGLRFDEAAVRAGLGGVMRIMRHVGMIDGKKLLENAHPPLVTRNSAWVRAPSGGLVRLHRKLGDAVLEDETIGVVSDMFGIAEQKVTSPSAGIIIGRTNLPIVNEGDALVHVARVAKAETAAKRVESIVETLQKADMFYEDEII